MRRHAPHDEDDDGDSVQLVYFEVTEYVEDDECSMVDTLSTVGTDSFSFPLSVDEQTLEDDPCTLWPPLDSVATSERLSSADTEVAEPVDELSLKDSLSALLAIPSCHGSAYHSKADALMREREGHRRGSVSCCGTQLSMNQILARRSAAATILTHGCSRECGPPLPILPAAVAHEILKAALPLAPPLARFVNTTGVDLQSSMRLSCLQLASAQLNADMAGVVAWLMRQNASLCSVDVSNNELGVAGCSVIINALPDARALTTLAMNEVSMCSAGGTDPSALVQLACKLDQIHSLRELELRHNAFGASGTSGLRALGDALARPNCALRKLDIAGNSLQSAGAAIIAVAVAHTACLEELNLSSNMLMGIYGKAREGVRALAVALAYNKTVRVLDLSYNSIGARRSESMDQWYKTPSCATVHLVRALEQNSTLKELRLGGNHLVGSQSEELTQVVTRIRVHSP